MYARSASPPIEPVRPKMHEYLVYMYGVHSELRKVALEGSTWKSTLVQRVAGRRHLGQPRRAVRPLLEHGPPAVTAVEVDRLDLGIRLALDTQTVVPDGL
eukprot:scaffold46494_cov25-Phaeocystis_antarctica.AAC.1